MPSDALKDRWEYMRWYPTVILFFNGQKDAISQRKNCAPERCQLPEHNGGDEDNLWHCGWGATVDTIGRSQVCTAKKYSILPPNSSLRAPLRRTGNHGRARERAAAFRAMRGVNLSFGVRILARRRGRQASASRSTVLHCIRNHSVA